jgi:xanthine dehydrogenase accessory factor
MIDVLPQIEAWQAVGERVAVATVVRVLGSAPRPVGATMAVSSGGDMAGSVSGGCVETTVYAELADILAGGQPRRLEFGITEDMIWDVGLACGGTIDLFAYVAEPDLVQAVASHLARKAAFALVITLDEAKAAAGWGLAGREGVLAGEVPAEAAAVAGEMLAEGAPRGCALPVARGGEAYIEPFQPAPRLVIIGGVHVGIPLSRFARELGFAVVVVDPRSKFANRERFPDADEILVAWPDEALAGLAVDERTYIVLLTHDPKLDEPALASALQTGAAYIGAIGSRKTHAERFARMARRGVTDEELGRVYAPIGLDLGGGTPEETALSIIAEVVAVKNGRSGGSLRQGTGSIGRG